MVWYFNDFYVHYAVCPVVYPLSTKSLYLCIQLDREINNSAFVNHAQICSWNQPVLSNEGKGKVSCEKETKRVYGDLKGLHQLCVRCGNHCATLVLI